MPSPSHALVVGKFAPLHRGHQLVLDAAATYDEITVIVWSTPDFDQMPSTVRAEWIRALYPRAVVLVPEDGPANSAPDDTHHAYVASLLQRSGREPDVVLTSEGYGPAFAAYLGVEHRSIDPSRTTVPTSGSEIRADVHRHRALLDPIVYRHFVDRVVFVGAESTGKTTMAQRAAEAFDTEWVPEVGRDYYAERGGALELPDYVEIAHRHRALEDERALHANRWLFVDTNALTTMFFSHYYDRGSLPELRRLADECATRYRHHIVCDDDIPFEQDSWRDNAVWRSRMQGMVLHDLAVRSIPFELVAGTVGSRLEQLRAVLSGGSGSPARAAGGLGPSPR